jgi:excisionase family DNA binding protein
MISPGTAPEASTMTTTRHHRALTPTEQDVRQARRSRAMLDRLQEDERVVLELVARGEDEERIPIPAALLELLTAALDEIAAGRGVAVAALEEELTTQEAADLLNVSRPFLIRLLEEGRIPFRKVGTHRRLRLADVLDYKCARDAQAERAYEELVAQAQELHLGYD